jgi:arginyl-tRNA synthetase
MNGRELGDEEKKNISEIVGVSALKYSILKSSLGSDIIYDFEKSISFDGDSGPYLQYTAVRANSILEKAKDFEKDSPLTTPKEITNLEKTLYQFPEVVEHAYSLLEPHHIATYLTGLASDFNTFYGNTKILVDDNKYINYHLDLVKAFYQTMKNGLYLLGIETPNKM